MTHRTQRSGGPRARQKTKLSGRWIGADGAFAVLAGLEPLADAKCKVMLDNLGYALSPYGQ